jgi:hypothetical protein
MSFMKWGLKAMLDESSVVPDWIRIQEGKNDPEKQFINFVF